MVCLAMSRWWLLLCALTVLVPAGCADDARPSPLVDAGVADAVRVDAPPPGCLSNASCDDGVGCTEDLCLGGRCVHEPQRARCVEGSACDLLRGCLARRSCRESADCDDSDPCTSNERCDTEQRYCVFDELPAGTLCGAPGSGRVCRGGACNCPDAQPLTCAGACIDPQNDARHCGRCGNACGAGAWCSAGQCTCSAPQSWCPGVGCVDRSRDLQHCGACGLQCTAGARCEEGRCVLPCPAGTHRCGAQCLSDTELGSCGTRCTPCDAVSNGAARCLGMGPTALCGAVCNAGFHVCGQRCLPDADLGSCGTRCSPCPTPSNGRVACAAGQCVITCNAGFHVCGERCAPDSSVDSCGARCDPCPQPENSAPRCAAGLCEYVCNPGFQRCNGICSDGSTTLACGPSCTPCIAPQNGTSACTLGRCESRCNLGFHACGAQCLFDNDPASCGARCTPCEAPQHAQASCDQGVCGFVCDPGYARTVAGRCEELPRNVWPPSGTLVTGRRPQMVWRAPGATGAENERVELCEDRACTRSLGTLVAQPGSGRPAQDLPRGDVFWRVRVGEQVGPAWRMRITGRPSLNNPSLAWGSTADYDADGFDDLAVGAPFTGTPVGRLNVYRGGADGLRADRRVRLEGGTNRGAFGAALATGDLNGDGVMDLAIGSPNDLGDAGGVFVFYGRTSGFSLGPDETLRAPEGPMTGFGATLNAAGDFNGDGYADLVAGAPGYLVGAGRAYIYYGSPRGLSMMPNVILRAPETASAHFGSAVALVGDLDGDLDSELVIGADEAASFSGRGYLYFGVSGAVSQTPAATLSAPEGGRFGAALAALGDLDGDGTPEVGVGAPAAFEGRGLVTVFMGGPGGLRNDRSVALAGGLTAGNFGAALSGVGDVDGDGFDDFMAGAPAFDAYSGRALFFRGGEGFATQTPQALFANEGPMAGFGNALAGPRDVDRDGTFDVAVGGDRARAFEGVVYLYRGGSSTLAVPSVITSPEGGNVRFGASLSARPVSRGPRPRG